MHIKKYSLQTKILIMISFFILTFFVINSGKSKAAMWPVGGENSGETCIEYSYGHRDYDSDNYVRKSEIYFHVSYNMENSYKSDGQLHCGVDISGKPGSTYQIIAIADCKVVATSLNRASSIGVNFGDNNSRNSKGEGGGYGNYVVLEDNVTKKCYLYGHLKAGSITVKKGDTVKAGEKIGIMGSSGDSGHMHLHFEVRKNINCVIQSPNATSSNLTSTNESNYLSLTENPINTIGTNLNLITNKCAKKVTKNGHTYVYFTFKFNQTINVIEYPTLDVTIGNQTKQGKFDHKAGQHILVYKIQLDGDNGFSTEGKSENIYYKLYGGSIKIRNGALKSQTKSINGVNKVYNPNLNESKLTCSVNTGLIGGGLKYKSAK